MPSWPSSPSLVHQHRNISSLTLALHLFVKSHRQTKWRVFASRPLNMHLMWNVIPLERKMTWCFPGYSTAKGCCVTHSGKLISSFLTPIIKRQRVLSETLTLAPFTIQRHQSQACLRISPPSEFVLKEVNRLDYWCGPSENGNSS